MAELSATFVARRATLAGSGSSPSGLVALRFAGPPVPIMEVCVQAMWAVSLRMAKSRWTQNSCAVARMCCDVMNEKDDDDGGVTRCDVKSCGAGQS